MGLDILIASIGIISFLIFLIIHFLTFRRFSTDEVLNSIMHISLTGGVINFVLIVLTCLLFQYSSIILILMAGVLSGLIYGLFIFFYILCIFGPYETSIRMRLVREVFQGPKEGITEEELLSRYNAKKVLDIRLRRLMASGEISPVGEHFEINEKPNIFFIIDRSAQILQRFILKKKDHEQ